MIVLILVGLALLAFAFFTLAILLPIALVGGIALHFYLKYRLRQARRHPQKRQSGPNDVIEVEYTIVERRQDG
jgi:hypothetical protein